MITPILCDDQHCNLPSARIVNGTLIIESKHRGQLHRCTISLHRLQILLTQDEHCVLDSVSTRVQHRVARDKLVSS